MIWFYKLFKRSFIHCDMLTDRSGIVYVYLRGSLVYWEWLDQRNLLREPEIEDAIKRLKSKYNIKLVVIEE